MAAGRRTGKTEGGSKGAIIKAYTGKPTLWVDVINANIDRYYQRYFEPELKKQGYSYNWNVQKKILEIGKKGGYIDFRSADRPQSIEGFAYPAIFLNEAGIILRDDYLYTNTILPMLMDYEHSQLYAFGTPKGKINKDGTEHRFYTLFNQQSENYNCVQLSSYDNPRLKQEDIRALEAEMSIFGDWAVQQEIYGKFIDGAGTNPFASAFDENIHVQDYALFNPRLQVIISIDFNLDPFCAVFGHAWTDHIGDHVHVFAELEIRKANIDMMADGIRSILPENAILNCIITGDYQGNKRDIANSKNYTYFEQLASLLGLGRRSLSLKPNPFHGNSRADVNYVLSHHPDFAIHPKCRGAIRDLKFVQCDTNHKIIKSNRKDVMQQADFLDDVRYLINNTDQIQKWMAWHKKQR